MTTSQLKTALHESIENITDTDVLKTLNEISTHHYTIVSEPDFNEYEIQRLAESEEQILSGNTYTNEQANELIQKWLNK